MARKIEDIFNECYERIRSGESLESCLRSYPEYRAQLDPLLRTTFDIGRRSSYIQPRPEFRHWSRVRLETAQRYPRQPQQAPAATPMASGWLRHGWALAVTAGIIILLGTGSTMAASSNALPDEPLYPVKLATEQIQLAFAVTPTRQAEVETDITNARATELEAMAEQGKTEEAAKAAERYNAQYEKALEAIADAEGTTPQPTDFVPPGTATPSEFAIPDITAPPTPVTTATDNKTTTVTAPPTTEQPSTTAQPPSTTEQPSTTTAEQPPATTTQPPTTTTEQQPATTETTVTTQEEPATTGQPSTTTQPSTTSKDDSRAARIERMKKALDHSSDKSIAALTDAKDKALQSHKNDWQKAIDTVNRSREHRGRGTTSDNQTSTDNQTQDRSSWQRHDSHHR